MDLEEIRKLANELDKGVSRENAKVGLYQYGGADDESCMVGTRNGYLRFGVELLKAGTARDSREVATGTTIDVDIDYLLDDQSTISFNWFEIVEEVTNREHEESWGDTVFIYTVIGLLIAIPILALIGLVALIRLFL